jgi:histidinol-phosphatase
MPYTKQLEFARRIAAVAGENAVRRVRAGKVTVVEWKSGGAPVTDVDKENQQLIRDAILAEFPDDAIIGEEDELKKDGSNRRRWFIDPIDGTRDFVRGSRIWDVMVGFEEAGELQVGVAHFPFLDETYWAVRGNGSFLNDGIRLRVSDVKRIDRAVLSVNGFQHEEISPHLSAVVDLMRRAWAVRAYGCALDACLLASGKCDIWFNPKVGTWDLAALRLIIEEAGGVFFALDGSRHINRGTAVGCAPGIEDEVRHAFGVPIVDPESSENRHGAPKMQIKS